MSAVTAPVATAAVTLLAWSLAARLAQLPARVGPTAVRGPRAGRVPRRHRRADSRSLPALLDEVASALRAGAALPRALHDAAAGGPPGDMVRAELGHALAPTARGWPLADALEQWHHDAASPEAQLAAGALALTARLGAGEAAALESASAVLRDRAALADEQRAQTAQARASAAVLTVLPPLVLLAAALQDADVAAFLLTPAGAAALVAGLALDAAGAIWMRHEIREATR